MTIATLNPVLVAGAGSWGTALAILLARNNYPTLLWGRDPLHIQALINDRCNNRYLPGIDLPETLVPVLDFHTQLAMITRIIIATPLSGLRSLIRSLPKDSAANLKIAIACKGIETHSHLLVHQVVAEELGDLSNLAIISGPSFAKDVASGLPTAVTVASFDLQFAQEFAAILHSGTFRAYSSDDLIGVEIGGAIKNVLAIAAGVADGLGFGANTRAALITRGLHEIMRFGLAFGGKRETFMGLSGLGDLVLTCTDNQSRNRRLGLQLAKGSSLPAAIKEIGQVVEGVNTSFEVAHLAEQHNIDMPISKQVVQLLKGECSPHDAVRNLLNREPKQEVY